MSALPFQAVSTIAAMVLKGGDYDDCDNYPGHCDDDGDIDDVGVGEANRIQTI